MPILDMPLSELKQYCGRNPRPEDLDEYWNSSLKEMRSVERSISVVPAEDFSSPIADCYDMYFTGVNGARVYAKLLKPKKIVGKCPAVIHFHGYNGKSHGWVDYLSYVASGFVVAAMDCRGQAGRSVDVGGNTGKTTAGHIIRGLRDDPMKLMFRDIFLDTAELADIIMSMPEVDESRVGAYGGSQGGALTIACSALEPRIAKAAPCYPFLCDYKRVWEMDMAERAYAELKTFFRDFDPRHEREDEIFYKLGYIDLQFLAPRIKAEVKMFTGLMDNVCPPSTQFAAFNKMTCKKDVVIYPDFGHEGLPECNEITYEFMMRLR